MYSNYQEFLQKNENIDITRLPFKSNNLYCSILEHVSPQHGMEYLKLILSEFPEIKKTTITNFCNLNDKYGFPNKYKFNEQNFEIICSPTSLRYIYHALTILTYFKTTNCKNIVEVGCGYGGLCLCINYFMKFFSISIDSYNIIDLKEPCNLIEKYITLHKNNITTNVNYHNSETYGKNVNNEKLFFISNYCYTEIDKVHNKNYTDSLLPKTQNGFLVWQNGGNKGAYPINEAEKIIRKNIVNVIEEKPQTDAGYHIYKNYFVYF